MPACALERETPEHRTENLPYSEPRTVVAVRRMRCSRLGKQYLSECRRIAFLVFPTGPGETQRSIAFGIIAHERGVESDDIGNGRFAADGLPLGTAGCLSYFGVFAQRFPGNGAIKSIPEIGPLHLESNLRIVRNSHERRPRCIVRWKDSYKKHAFSVSTETNLVWSSCVYVEPEMVYPRPSARFGIGEASHIVFDINPDAEKAIIVAYREVVRVWAERLFRGMYGMNR